jgi:hypothetical protein
MLEPMTSRRAWDPERADRVEEGVSRSRDVGGKRTRPAKAGCVFDVALDQIGSTRNWGPARASPTCPHDPPAIPCCSRLPARVEGRAASLVPSPARRHRSLGRARARLREEIGIAGLNDGLLGTMQGASALGYAAEFAEAQSRVRWAGAAGSRRGSCSELREEVPYSLARRAPGGVAAGEQAPGHRET